MIPRLQSGGSFKGAGLYYLHDKRKEGDREPLLSSDRVAWTHTINLAHDDPELALEEMWQTVWKQPQLRVMAGHKPGERTEKPVVTVALSWSPDQSPTKDQMIAAGLRYLQHMTWLEHQAVFVAHDDTRHPHIHIILNRVHPDTGRLLDDGFSKTRTQQWALAYEREEGKVYCAAREARRERGELSPSSHMQRREWAMWQEIHRDGRIDRNFGQALMGGEWDALKSGQRAERDAFWRESKAQGKELRAALREVVKAEFAPEWKGYAKEKDELLAAQRLYDREARRAVKACLRTYGARDGSARIEVDRLGRRHRAPELADSARMILDIRSRQDAYHARVKERLRERRQDIHRRLVERVEELALPAFRHLRAERKAAYETVKAGHRAEKTELRRDQVAGLRRPDLLPAPTPKARDQGVIAALRRTVPHLAHARLAAERSATLPKAKLEVGQARSLRGMGLTPEQRRAATGELARQSSLALPGGASSERTGIARLDRRASAGGTDGRCNSHRHARRGLLPAKPLSLRSRSTSFGLPPWRSGRPRPYSTGWTPEQVQAATDGLGRQLSLALPPGSDRRDGERPRPARIDGRPTATTGPVRAIPEALPRPSRFWTDDATARAQERDAKTRALWHEKRRATDEVTGSRPPKEITDRRAATSERERKDALIERAWRRAQVHGWLARRGADHRSPGAGRDR